MPEVESEPGPDSKPAPRLGSYLLVQSLGSGGMSNVFRAVHEETGSVVAVKVLPRTLAKNATLLQRFMREAKSAEAMDHPNIVAIYDRGFDQGRHYLVLEYVEGRDMHDRVRLNGPLKPEDAVSFVREVAEGLRYAAAQGMIHRDVKPANLLMTPEGHAKIIDLGLALQIEDEDERVTRDGTTVGTVDYMAPEQARDSRQTSERSDMYSLGCTFYYLLTGSAPFPGGGLSDKLARHYKAPIPDVREHRPDVSEALGTLIRKMMEKKPEGRFADYTRLIEALDALDDPPTHDVSAESYDALIVDDDEDDEIGLAPTETSLGRRSDDVPLMAEIVDDDDEPRTPTLPPPGPRPRSKKLPSRGRPTQPASASGPAEISLADLAGLDADPVPARKAAPRSASSSAGLKVPSNPALAGTRPAAMPIAAMTEDDDEEVFGAEGPPRRSGADLPLKTWIAAGVMVGLSIAIVGFGASMVVSMSKTEPEPEPIARATGVEPEPAPNAPATTYVPTRGSRPVGPTPKPAVDMKSQVATPTQPEASALVAKPRQEVIYDKNWEAKLRPSPSGRPSPLPGRATFVVRRLAQGADETASIAAALGRGNDLVEIADVGPFFEDDYQIAGKSRLIRAREGLRPMIKIEATTNPIIKAQAAKFVLGGTKVDHLVFEGIDFAVDVRDLPVDQTTLFLCQGVDLTLRNCSLTILNANDPARANPFSVFRLEEGPKPNRIVLDRTTVRGSIKTLVEIASAQADVEFDRSLVLADSGPLLVAGPGEKTARSFYFHRSLLITRGPLLELTGKGGATLVRSLGSTFARVEGPTGAGLGLFATQAAFAGEPPTLIDWAGEANHFAGWPAWLASTVDGSARVARLDGVRSAWPGSDGSSRESPSAWPAHVRPDAAVPLDFADLEPGLAPSLAMVAVPHSRLRELTIDSLSRLVTPELSATLVTPYVAPVAVAAAQPGRPVPPTAPKLAAPTPNATGPRPKNPRANGPAMRGAGPATPPPPGPVNLTFNLNESPWMGDLGLYLAEKIVPGTPWASILVRGSGVHAMTPIRLPDGLSISIQGDQTLGLAAAMPTFVPKAVSAGRSMIELRGGDLAIANLGFLTEGAQRPEHWVLVEDGILGIRHCRFRDSGPSTASAAGPSASGALIAFVARGTAPILPRAGPLVKETNRPTARLQHTALWTTGPALAAEVGRGSVALDDCLVISGGPAFTLRPADVDRDRFEADLVLDRCTIAVDRTSVLLGPLLGEPKGPSRPWLVSSRRCAFPRTQPVGGAGALLQTDSDALARGALFWQSSFDVYDGYHFLAPTGPAPANQPATDIKKQWFDLWGEAHTRGDQGPTARRSETSLRYKERDRPKPGKVVPSALELDKAAHSDLGVDFNNLPTFVAGRPPTDPPGRPAPGTRFDRP